MAPAGNETRMVPDVDARIWVALPDKLLAELDTVAQVAGMSRDDVLRRAVEAYVDRTHRTQAGAAMARGYQEMGRLNLALAVGDEDSLSDWDDDAAGPPEVQPRGGV